MFAAASSHKRRRASARGDQARKRQMGRIVLNAAGTARKVTDKGKEKAADGNLEADDDEALFGMIRSHPFNHKLIILIPQTESDPVRQRSLATLIHFLRDQAAAATSSLLRVSLTALLSPEFVANHIKGGSVVALSTGQLDTDDVICIDGQGTMILHVSKDTYQILGLTGRRSRFSLGASGRYGDRNSGPTDRYIIEIPLNDPTFRPGKPGWQRVVDRFEAWERRRGVTFSFAFAESGNGRDVHFNGQSSEARGKQGIKASFKQRTLDDVWVPTPADCLSRRWADPAQDSSEQSNGTLNEQGVQWDDMLNAVEELAEWKVLAERDAPCIKTYHNASPNLAEESYDVPEPRQVGKLLVFELTGFLHSDIVVEAQKAVRSYLDEALEQDAKSLPWAAMSVEGFPDSPVRWRSRDPGWGLALGQGRSIADEQQSRSHGGGHRRSRQDRSASPASGVIGSNSHDMNVSQTSDDSDDNMAEEDDESVSSDSSDSSDSDDSEASQPLTGKRARRKRSKRRNGKGYMGKGESERSVNVAAAGSGASGGGASAFGWGCLLFGRGSAGGERGARDEGSRQEQKGVAGYNHTIWWENVTGDTRN